MSHTFRPDEESESTEWETDTDASDDEEADGEQASSRKCYLVFFGNLSFVRVTSGPVFHDAIQRFVSLMVLMCMVVLSGVSWILLS